MTGLARKRILVTGGAGFLGSHLVDRLVEEGVDRITVVDNFFLGRDENLVDARAANGAELQIYREDAGDPDAMAAICRAEQPDLVFNLATKPLTYSFFNPAGAASTSIDVAIVLAELLRLGAFARLVQISSSEVYGSAVRIPMAEDHPLHALTPYAAGKAGADLLLASYGGMFGLDIVTVRPFNNYGPRQNPGELGAVVPTTIRRILASEVPIIQGSGDQTRDFIYASDTVEAIVRLAALDHARGLTVHVGSGRETRIGELVEQICMIMDYRGEIVRLEPRTADVERHCADISTTIGLIGAFATTGLGEGLKTTVAWFEEELGEARASSLRA